MKRIQGFTLIELLVVIAITGILIGLSLFGIQGARESARDANRKSDLEQIRSGLEIYKSDCGIYPDPVSYEVDSPLHGYQTTGSCLTTNEYISEVPSDPVASQKYFYGKISDYRYVLCAALEHVPTTNVPTGTTCQGASGENCGVACNYYITNP
jgi:prepilin-type N-terminal cleavage/methylation domain-containing protein